MKKLMIAAAAAAMIGGAYADACNETVGCKAWDLKFSLKTLQPKKTTCKDECGEKETVYFLDAASRTLKGYLWTCDYACENTDYNVVLWDVKNQVAIIAYSATPQTVAIDQTTFMAYGKKANKVAGNIEFVGNNAVGTEAINVTAAGINGTMKFGSATDDCYLKSLSGYAAGSMLPSSVSAITVTKKSTLCEDVEITVCNEFEVKTLTMCDACCFENWCDEDIDVLGEDDLVPAVGSWSMKYNASVSKGNKAIVDLIPAYAL